MTAGSTGGLRQRKYAAVLALLCVALAVETVGARGAGRYLSDALGTVLAVAIWFVIFERRRERTTMAVVLVAALALAWGRYLVAERLDYALSLAEQTMLALLLWSAVYVILRDLFRIGAAGVENVLGAICGYLIAGNAWARINAITYLLVPSAYSINPEIAALLPDWHGRSRCSPIMPSPKY